MRVDVRRAFVVLLSLLLAGQAMARPVRGRFRQGLPSAIAIVRGVPYGSDPRQRFDVYAPAHAKDAPVIFVVHGGAWRLGSRSASAVVEHKVARWVPRGCVVISTDYRLLPAADPLEQARDVARALATAQQRAAEWGADRRKFVLMGHSAGAHLVALLATEPAFLLDAGALPWLGAVLLDSAALDLVAIMEGPHPRLYDVAFGHDRRYWRSASPLHALARRTAPILAVCSSRRAGSCLQARTFVGEASSLGGSATVLEKDLSHEEINARLGEDPRYTEQVDSFLAGLDPSLSAVWTRPSP